jgi:hypothetical protein
VEPQYRTYSRHYPKVLFAGIVPIHILCFYWWSAEQYYFTGDALFYFSRQIVSLSDFASRFLGVDDLYQYRPLTYVFFSFVLRPLFGNSPQPYHIIAYLFTALNGVLACACIYYWSGRKASMWCFASAFLLLNPVHFFPAFGPTYIDQWLSTMFYFTTLLIVVRNPSWTWVVAPLTFLLALASKEHSVTLPAHAVILMVACNTPVREAFRRTRNLWIVLFAFLAFQFAVRQGVMYSPPEINPNLQFAFSADRILELVRGAKSVIFYPENYALAAALGIGRPIRLLWVIPCIVAVGLAIRRQPRLALSGLAWFVIALAPVAFIQMPPFGRHYYIGMAGLAVVFSCAIASWRTMAMVAPVLALLTVTDVDLYARESWVAVGARHTRDYVAQIGSMLEQTGRPVFYATRNSDEGLHWNLDHGEALPLVLNRDVSVLFGTLGEELPVDELLANRVNVVLADNGRLSDPLSEGAFPPPSREDLCGVLPFIAPGDCAVIFRGRPIVMDNGAVVETPTGFPIFTSDQGVVTLSRTTISFPYRDDFELNHTLRVIPESADGVIFRIHIQRGSTFELVFSAELAPGERRTVNFKLGRVEADRIVIRISPGANRDEDGDWVVWERELAASS